MMRGQILLNIALHSGIKKNIKDAEKFFVTKTTPELQRIISNIKIRNLFNAVEFDFTDAIGAIVESSPREILNKKDGAGHAPLFGIVNLK